MEALVAALPALVVGGAFVLIAVKVKRWSDAEQAAEDERDRRADEAE